MKKIKALVSEITSIEILLGFAFCLYLAFLIVNVSKLF
jgi:hypothetical protein